MGRQATFNDRDVYAAVGEELAITGNFTLARLTKATKLSTGSIYHRFASREQLLAETWLHAVGLFQSDFLKALESKKPDAGESAALSIPIFSRANRDEAIILASCRQEQFLGPKTPPGLALEISSVNKNTAKEIKKFARAINRPLLACKLALVAYPLAAVRLFLPKDPVPKSIDAEIIKAYRSALAYPDLKELLLPMPKKDSTLRVRIQSQ